MLVHFNEPEISFVAGSSRFIAALVCALVTTALILFVMFKLIDKPMSPPEDSEPVSLPQVTLDDRTPPTENPEPIEPPERAETPPEIPEPILKNNGSPTLVIPTVPVDPGDSGKPTLELGNSRMPIPQVLSAPRYPTPALNKNIEGWVELRFDVSAQGSTENIEVLAASPEGWFERAAVKAAEKWRYQPMIDDRGDPVGFPGMKRRVVFEIQK